MRQLLVSSSPHIRTKESVPKIMWTVVLALVPAWLAAIFFYGPSALALGVSCIVLCVLIEYAIVYSRTKPEPRAAVERTDAFTLAARGKIRAAEVSLAEREKRELTAPEAPKGFLQSYRHRKAWSTAMDGSAAVTGLLFAMTLKPNTLYWVDTDGRVVSEWYVVVVGCIVAIALTKQLFGGLGCNIWNPALAARAFVQVSYGKEVNGKFMEPFAWIGSRSQEFFGRVSQLTTEVPEPNIAANRGVDAISQSTPLEWFKQGKLVWGMGEEKLQGIAQALNIADLKQLPAKLGAYMQINKSGGDLVAAGLAPADPAQLETASQAVYESVWGSMLDWLPNFWWGAMPGSMGETAAILLLIGGVFLWAKGYLDWRVPVFYLATVALLSLVVPYKDFSYGFGFLKPEHLWYKSAFHLGAGGLMLGAWFMATDMVSSPVSKTGNLIFGVGCGVLTVVIRNFAAYPEGVCYAILIMNTATPIIDRFTKPRVFGTKLNQAPKEAAKT